MTAKNPNAIERKRASLKETDRAARVIIEEDAQSTRKKTARLKAKRLLKEAEGDASRGSEK
jgi:hypothetical protein